MYKTIALLSLCCAIMLESNICAAQEKKVLQIEFSPQLQTYWCWAASTQTALECISPNNKPLFKQCVQAEKNPKIQLIPPEKCCQGPNAPCDNCNQRSWPIFEQLGYQSVCSEFGIDWKDIKKSIDEKRPILFAVIWDGGGGHMLCIYGYEENILDEKILYVFDPLPIPDPNSNNPALKRGGDNFQISYEEYRAGSKSPHRFGKSDWPTFTHWRTYCGIEEQAPGGGESITKHEISADNYARNTYSSIKTKIINSLGPGGSSTDLALGDGITFHQIPLKAFANPDAPGGESLFSISKKSAKVRVYMIKSPEQNKILGCMSMTWSSDTPMKKQINIESGKSLIFESQVEEALKKYKEKYPEATHDLHGYTFQGLQKSFLYSKRDGKEELIPIAKDPDLKLEPGIPLPIEEMTAKMKKLAKERLDHLDVP